MGCPGLVGRALHLSCQRQSALRQGRCAVIRGARNRPARSFPAQTAHGRMVARTALLRPCPTGPGTAVGLAPDVVHDSSSKGHQEGRNSVSMPVIDYLIIGGGLAGVTAAETIRALSPRGSVAIVSGEIDPPHDRPPLSKELLRDERSRQQVLLRPLDFYQSRRIGLVLGRPALLLKPETREVLLADGETVGYQRLLLAT